jgi:hypothetical protein
MQKILFVVMNKEKNQSARQEMAPQHFLFAFRSGRSEKKNVPHSHALETAPVS